MASQQRGWRLGLKTTKMSPAAWPARRRSAGNSVPGRLPPATLPVSATSLSTARSPPMLISGAPSRPSTAPSTSGNPDGLTYQPGITIDGGTRGLSGGAGGSETGNRSRSAFYTDKSPGAIAIGNSASASNGASTALGRHRVRHPVDRDRHERHRVRRPVERDRARERHRIRLPVDCDLAITPWPRANSFAAGSGAQACR